MPKTYQSTLDVETIPDALKDAEDFLNKSEYKKAFNLIRDDDSFKALILKAKIQSGLNDYESAIGYIDDALNLESELDVTTMKAQLLYEWAKITYFPQADYEKALKLINRALDISPDEAEYWFLKGEIFQSQERHIDARRCMLKAENRLEELEILESELDQFELHRQDTLINVTGVGFYHSLTPFRKGTILKLARDDENEHDPDAIACLLNGEIVGYVANSEYTLINGVKSASEIREIIDDDSTAEVLFIFQNEFVIAKVMA